MRQLSPNFTGTRWHNLGLCATAHIVTWHGRSALCALGGSHHVSALMHAAVCAAALAIRCAVPSSVQLEQLLPALRLQARAEGEAAPDNCDDPRSAGHARKQNVWSQGAFEESWACRMPCPTSPPLLDGTKLAASAQPEAIYRARQSTALAGKIVIRVKHVEPAAPTAPVPVVLAAADVAVAD